MQVEYEPEAGASCPEDPLVARLVDALVAAAPEAPGYDPDWLDKRLRFAAESLGGELLRPLPPESEEGVIY